MERNKRNRMVKQGLKLIKDLDRYFSNPLNDLEVVFGVSDKVISIVFDKDICKQILI